MNRQELLTSIATTIQDYRAGELPQPTADHVDRWIMQLDQAVQLPMLREIDHVFKQTYLSKELIGNFLGGLVKNKELAGADPCAFWSRANLLRIQKNGHSQKEMLELFGEKLEEICGIDINGCGNVEGDFIYLDDAIFSGSRVGNDLESWIRDKAPKSARLHVVLGAMHTLGTYFVQKRLTAAIKESQKKIEIRYWRVVEVESRNSHRNNSEVLWPAVLPNDEQVKAYLAQPQKFPFQPRKPGGNLGPFSSEEGRQLLESQLLLAGVRIRALSKNPKDVIRPLGFSPFGVGFGSMIVTYRNCPNNCPLAMWWGDPEATSGPFHWYPLLPRKTYGHATVNDFDAIL